MSHDEEEEIVAAVRAGKQRMRGARRRHLSTGDSEPILRNRANSMKTIYTAGRPPWYKSNGEQAKMSYVIGVCGGSASGKTTVAKNIIEGIDIPWVVLLSMDSFYKGITTEEDKKLAATGDYNFDHPDAFDWELMRDVVGKLKEGKSVEIPIYDFTLHQRVKETKRVYGATVILFEGIMTFCDEKIRDLMDVKVFVDTESDIRLARRLMRDISNRGRKLDDVLNQYNRFVKPAYDKYIAPTCQFCDIVVPRGGSNKVAINLIVKHVMRELNKRRENVETICQISSNVPFPSSLHLLPQTSQNKGIQTIIRCKDTSRDEFIFYSERLMRLVFEYALSFLPHKQTIVKTPQGVEYEGLKFSGNGLCGVSILRAGETMEHALMKVTKDIRLGKILIQTDSETHNPELYFLRLPRGIKDDHVILMDASVATGAAAMMAIRVLLDHDVLEENILLASLLMAAPGVHAIAYAYPKVKIITAAVDPEISPDYRIMPGLGNFGDRYFGTTTPEQEPIRPTHRSPIHHNRPVFNELGSDSSFMEL